jgi:hypothetical protein
MTRIRLKQGSTVGDGKRTSTRTVNTGNRSKVVSSIITSSPVKEDTEEAVPMKRIKLTVSSVQNKHDTEDEDNFQSEFSSIEDETFEENASVSSIDKIESKNQSKGTRNTRRTKMIVSEEELTDMDMIEERDNDNLDLDLDNIGRNVPSKAISSLSILQRSEKARIRRLQKEEQLEADKIATISKLLYRQAPKKKKSDTDDPNLKNQSESMDKTPALRSGYTRWISNSSGFFLCYPSTHS